MTGSSRQGRAGDQLPATQRDRRRATARNRPRGEVWMRSRSAWMHSRPWSSKSSHPLPAGARSSRPFAASTAAGRPSSCGGCRSTRNAKGFATAEVQISETETPLHRLETVYRRLTERLSTADTQQGRPPVHPGQLVLCAGGRCSGRGQRRGGRCRSTSGADDRSHGTAPRGGRPPRSGVRNSAARLATGRGGERAAPPQRRSWAWIGGQPNVGAAAKRYAGVKGDLDHFGAPQLFSRACSSFCATRASRGWSWCSMRWRRSSGSVAMCGRRA